MIKKLGSILLSCGLLACLSIPVLGAEHPEYPAKTMEFSSASDLSQWTRLGHPDGTMEIVDGALQLGSSVAFGEVAALYTGQKCRDFTAEFVYKFPKGGNNDAAMFTYRADTLAAQGYAVYFVHCPDADKQYYIKFTSRPYQDIQAGFFFNNDGAGVAYATDSVKVKMVVSGATHTLYMTVPGKEYGEPVFSITEETPRYDNSGYIGFMQWHDAGTHEVATAFDDLTITCDDEGEAPIPEVPADTTAVTAGKITQDFSSPLSDKWGFYRGDVGGNKAEVVDDLLLLTTVGGNVPGESAAYYKENFQNGTIEADVNLSTGNSTSIAFRGQDHLRKGYQLVFDRYTGLKLCKRPYEVLASATGFDVQLDVVYSTKITVEGNRIQVAVTYEDDAGETKTVNLDYTDEANSYPDAGYVGFINYAGMANKTEAMFDNLVITKIVEGQPVPDTSETSKPGNSSKPDDSAPNTGVTALPVLALTMTGIGAGTLALSRRRSQH